MQHLKVNTQGLHFAEMFFDESVMDMLPGLLPTDNDPGDRWDPNLMSYYAYVGNIGCIGEFHSKAAATKACRETVKCSTRADKRWFVQRFDGEIVAERGCHE